MSIARKITDCYTILGQRVGAAIDAPSRQHVQTFLFMVGVLILTVGLSAAAGAQNGAVDYNSPLLAGTVNAIMTYIEGTFGALIMACAGIGAIVTASQGQFRTAIGLLVVALGCFNLRSLVGTFFDDHNIQP